MQYAYPHKYTCTLDRCKQKERKKERKKEEKGKKTKGTRVFSAIHSNVVAMKKNLETIFGGEGKKKKEKWEIHSCFIRIGYIQKHKYGHDRWRMLDGRTQSDTLDDLHSRSSEDNHSSINPSSFCFSMLYPVVDVYATQQHPSYIAHIRFTRSYTREIIHLFSNKNLRDSTTHQPSFSFLGIARLSSIHTNDNIDIIRVVYTPIRQLKRYYIY